MRRLRLKKVHLGTALLLAASPTLGLQPLEHEGRFDALIRYDPSVRANPVVTSIALLDSEDSVRAAWNRFRSRHGPKWSIHLDRRSGAPLLVEGEGIPWISASGDAAAGGIPVTTGTLEESLRTFIASNRALFQVKNEELVLNQAASGRVTSELWQIVFDRVVGGIPVTGERYIFAIGHGRLMMFGASRWSPIETAPAPKLDAGRARRILHDYMGLKPSEQTRVLDAGSLVLVPHASAGTSGTSGLPYAGPLGSGYRAALAWRFAMRVVGEHGTWIGLVDAQTGAVLALYDDNKYAKVKGGVYPVTGDAICPDGCEQQDFPMPFAHVSVGISPRTASTMGIFDCSPAGSTAATALAGPYVIVNDNCGAISESATCGADLDLRLGPGTDCSVPAGSSDGNTHASRSTFYHLNRLAEKGRAWLPGNAWLTQQLADNVNFDDSCNAFWDGTVTFFKSGNGCINTGEIAGTAQHEWGHGLDANDGGGYDNPSEAYADITEFLEDHTSCIGRGLRPFQNCDGNGNVCLECTGVREQDWDRKADHTPSTPAGFVTSYCPLGSGPCGRQVHCEGHVGAETLWDLAVRDLPAAGLDPDTAWQMAEKLWYTSRFGSGGNAYNCSLPSSDGCGATTWFTRLRIIDDDDGNLANGTPHASAIFAAFDRHGIACGSAGDTSNRSSSTCPLLGGSTLTAVRGSGSVALSWTPVSGAASYRILRNDIGCARGSTIIATVPAPQTSYADIGLANGSTEHYRVQAAGSNTACDGPVSNCVAITPQDSAGAIRLDTSVYACTHLLEVRVDDANIGSPATTATVFSDTEASPQTLILSETAPGSGRFEGTITATPGPSPSNDGLLGLSDGDSITARYVDADDGQGGTNVPRETTASSDCAGPVAVTDLRTTNTPGTTAIPIFWTAPGDGGPLGRASSYEIRFTAAGPILTETDYDAALTAASPPIPRSAGSEESFAVGGLHPGSGYWFAIKSFDASGNISGLSNSPPGMTQWELAGLATEGSYRSVRVKELNGDGNPDIVATSSSRDNLFWYEAPDDPLAGLWTEHPIGDAASLVDEVYGFDLGDMDGDDDEDAVAVSKSDGGVYWFEHPADPTEPWNRHVIALASSTFDSWDVAIADIDQDGDPDVVVTVDDHVYPPQDTVRWYRAPDEPSGSWDGPYTIGTGPDPAVEGLGVEVVDLDGDGDPDAVGAESGGAGIAWYRAPDNPTGSWTRHPIDASLSGRDVQLGDIDRDGDLDVVASASAPPYLVWEENPGSPTAAWARHVIAGTGGSSSQQLAVADLDRDGDLDVLAMQGMLNNGIFLWEAPADPKTAWTRRLLNNSFSSEWGVATGDIDGDGLTDAAATGAGAADGLIWLRNALPGARMVLNVFRTGTGGARVDWNAVPGAQLYEIVRGDLIHLHQTGQMGAVTCLTPNGTTATLVDDDTTPLLRGGFTYLGRFFDSVSWTAYGSGSDGRPRTPNNGDCP